ncbi:MAG: zinc ribbon domain-containing protein [Methanomicrobiales archaeon]|nr:zinc ribbon domain-containing protein [Methanomicrobiales archaeon]
MEDEAPRPVFLRTCPSCGSLVEAEHQFCELCGTEMEELPVCRKCGARFLAPVKFCEICGTPAIPKEKPQVIVRKAVSLEPDAGTEIVPDNETRTEQEPDPVGKTIYSNRDPLAHFDDPELPEDVPMDAEPASAQARVKPPRNMSVVIGAIVLLLIICAGVFFVILPLIDGSGTVSPQILAPPPTGTQVPVPSTLPTVVPTSVPATIPPTPNYLLPKPTESMPDSQSVIFQVQKDPITAMITVIFAGGPGANTISGGDVTVTSDDGTVQTGTIRPSEGETELVLKGTKGKDRIEVVARMYSGRTYRVIDEIMSYTERA